MVTSFWSLLSWLFVLAHLVPPVVGLVLVARIRSARPWRTWALLGFALALLSGLAQAALTGSYWFGGMWGMGPYPVVAVVQTLLGLVSLAAAGLGVVAVVADRREDPPPVSRQRPGTYSEQPYPPQR